MKLEHVAIWTRNLEAMRAFYETFFRGESNAKYYNTTTGLESYFLRFESGARLELLHKSDIPENRNDTLQQQHLGLIHLAFEVESREAVESKARELAQAGFPILRGPRVTGDGYYEFESHDPEQNRLEVSYRLP
ncbi:VOC family protein [Siphonobacter curvatus]|uniref:Glyoxalase n=1 Tax=Siphonobacter curvatus TaxID=2094562 RepID=A0A2S7IGH9_9BACT|nr:VOC family protein [Siphonobacter curvatus]PQA54393.1 glyoxalase [Siphonobacter curvatus]